MSQFYVPGACQIFVGTGTAGALEFLGWSLDGVMPRIQANHEDLYSDFSGMAPDDVAYYPGTAMTSFTLARYNETVATKLMQWIPTNTAGASGVGAVGTLMVAEGMYLRVLFHSPYGSLKPAMTGMVSDLNFPISFPVNDFSVSMSSRARRFPLTFRHINNWDHVAGTGVLWNQSADGMPAVN